MMYAVWIRPAVSDPAFFGPWDSEDAAKAWAHKARQVYPTATVGIVELHPFEDV
jgi:hypothetical protein